MVHSNYSWKCDGTILALSPIHHGGDEKTGSTPVLRAITIWDATQQRHVRLPFISGNAIRGVLRRLVMRHLLTALGIDNVSAKLHHALFSGGVLESVDDEGGVIDLEFRRYVRQAVPAIGLFGTAVANQMIPGSLRVSHAMPICSEYAAYLPGEFLDARAMQSVRTFTDIAFATRRDDLKAEKKEDEQATQMKIEFEAFIPGTLFFHSFACVAATELEIACLGKALELWTEAPYIGGKSSSGYGKIRFNYNPWPNPYKYTVYLLENMNEMRTALEKLADRLGNG